MGSGVACLGLEVGKVSGQRMGKGQMGDSRQGSIVHNQASRGVVEEKEFERSGGIAGTRLLRCHLMKDRKECPLAP